MYKHKTTLSLPGPDDVLRQTLPNGLTLLVRENFASPTVVVSGYVNAGAADVPRDKIGLAGFTTDVMERGTHTRSFAQLYEEVESIAASFGLESGIHTTSFGAKGLAEHLPLLLDILNDVLRHPAFEKEQVEKARAEILTDIQERENDTQRMAALMFRELAYPEAHPLHWSQTGYNATISRLTRDDLAQFHAQFFAPQDAVIVVVGAVKAAVAAQAITDTFGAWQANRPPYPVLPPVPKLTERREKRLTIDDKTQSDLILGWPGPARLDPDFVPCFVANTVLGVFGMYGRLGKIIREANGLAYYVYSHIEGGKAPGPWRVIAGVNPANVDKTVTLIIQELHRIRDKRVSKDELNDSQSFLTGSLPLQLETNEGVAHALLNIERYNLGLDYLQRYTEMITAVTAPQVQDVAQRWLDPDHYALAVAEPSTS
ncbi:MAG TPA: pitrilysin family protein [Anaerolineae bacterium]|nr:pitrilysin family protein [Anaerolineae bacterium]HQH38251.1 pitrilysin family protein [Anaerolineae bacterium]